jgi:hypothetical protein
MKEMKKWRRKGEHLRDTEVLPKREENQMK